MRQACPQLAKADFAEFERVLGHAIAGVQGVYNRHSYLAEKSDALQKLATLVETILKPPDKTNWSISRPGANWPLASPYTQIFREGVADLKGRPNAAAVGLGKRLAGAISLAGIPRGYTLRRKFFDVIHRAA
jgi:hypothetical protein